MRNEANRAEGRTKGKCLGEKELWETGAARGRRKQNQKAVVGSQLAVDSCTDRPNSVRAQRPDTCPPAPEPWGRCTNKPDSRTGGMWDKCCADKELRQMGYVSGSDKTKPTAARDRWGGASGQGMRDLYKRTQFRGSRTEGQVLSWKGVMTRRANRRARQDEANSRSLKFEVSSFKRTKPIGGRRPSGQIWGRQIAVGAGDAPPSRGTGFGPACTGKMPVRRMGRMPTPRFSGR
jgi:hypothetical protein